MLDVRKDCDKAYVINAMLTNNAIDVINGNYNETLRLVVDNIVGADDIVASVINSAYSVVMSAISKFYNRPSRGVMSSYKRLSYEECITTNMRCNQVLNCFNGPNLKANRGVIHNAYYKFIADVFIEEVKRRDVAGVVAKYLNYYLVGEEDGRPRENLSQFEYTYLIPAIIEDGSIHLDTNVISELV